MSQTLAISPLYRYLDDGMKDDPEIQAQRAWIDQDQPNLILFMAAVNSVVMENPSCELAQFYPYLTAHPRPYEEIYPVLRRFCLKEHADELHTLLSHARLQTSEPGRCTALLPAFELVFRAGGRKPLALIEIGSSAGLLLNWMHYRYQYGESIVAGSLSSPVRLQCTLDSDQNQLPPLPETIPPIALCQGIERFPVDITKEQDRRWLRACVWTDAIQRYQRLDDAIELARQFPPTVHAGEASELLPTLLETITPDTTLCVFHSFALNQGPAEVKKQIVSTLTWFSKRQTVYEVSLEVEPPHRPLPWLELSMYRRGEQWFSEHLATCALHGESMQWHASY
ncbi:MAG TPA: DUF2332 domain-containing protein [Ktedonobacteraceae bacterium]|nr:DUF2332 domain-containing protein [Ktedonobacteraceae bacterium]